MDVRGALGLADDVRNGFEQIRVSFAVEGDAPAREAARPRSSVRKARSAVFDMVTNGVPVHVGGTRDGTTRGARLRRAPRPRPPTAIDTVVVGAGQAGLALSST
jgi:hypothetical protein